MPAVLPATTTDPQDVARSLVALADDRAPGWLDQVAEALDAHRGGDQLGRVLQVWGLSQAEAGRLFGVTRQAVAKWAAGGVPVERATSVADLAAATDLLVRYLQRDRIPAVVRRPAANLGGRSLVDLVADGDTRGVLDACRAMFDVYRAHL